ncbi:MAG: A/G-specific adenine glycosylase [Phycisphaerales bacterium]|nr:A/G-specific adenine glycosylase [Phycisphaerales bacterium]
MSPSDQRLAAAIEQWFPLNARDLPWRNPRTPWRALVSELMLQQTQVSRVLERFEPFMDRFATPCSLASADEQDVLAMWQGLGYYRRARSLHRAAREIVDRFDGEVPIDAVSLCSLPGVGRYTAGSIASIVGGAREAIVDGNVMRLLARVHCDGASPTDRVFIKRVWSWAQNLVDICEQPPLLNEGMMELGATVCTPTLPSCDKCPLAALCQSRLQGRVSEIPPPKRSAARQELHHYAVVIKRRGKVLLEQRAATGLWAGMWQAPAIESQTILSESEVIKRLPFPLQSLRIQKVMQRTLTHRNVTLHIYSGSLKRGARVPATMGVKWVPVGGLADVPISNAGHAVLAADNS